jgi:hypothetical protein
MLTLFYDGSNLEFPINTQKHIFCKGPSNEYCTQVCFQMGLWFKIGVILQYFSTTQLHCGGHLDGRAQLPDTILEEDHPMTIPSKFGFN